MGLRCPSWWSAARCLHGSDRPTDRQTERQAWCVRLAAQARRHRHQVWLGAQHRLPSSLLNIAINKLAQRNKGFKSSDLLVVVDKETSGEIRCQVQPHYVAQIIEIFGFEDGNKLEQLNFNITEISSGS